MGSYPPPLGGINHCNVRAYILSGLQLKYAHIGDYSIIMCRDPRSKIINEELESEVGEIVIKLFMAFRKD